MRVLKKCGHPFLLLPSNSRTAAACLDLYSAQTARGRFARAILRAVIRASIPFGAEKIRLMISPDDPFVKFLASLIGEQPENPPSLGILAGNPATEGQRFLVLLFGANEKPVAVIKAGVSEAAKALIQKEQIFLAAAPPNTAGLPRARATFESPGLRGLALDFYPGDSPRPHDESTVPALLESWLDLSQKIPLFETAAWSPLEKAVPPDQLRALGAGALRGHLIHPAIQHGDFAPWNIKVSPQGGWTVLDWERGEMAGVPAWDWFHYVIQPAILVERQPTSSLVRQIEKFLATDTFKSYAERAGIIGLERFLMKAYLLHMVSVVKPTEGLAQTFELLNAFSQSSV